MPRAEPDLRVLEAVILAERAAERLAAGNAGAALPDAARAAWLLPHDLRPARLYCQAADAAGTLADKVRAHAHLARLEPSNVAVLARLAYLRLQANDAIGARRAATLARHALPARGKRRSEWLSIIQHVEEMTPAAGAAEPADPASRSARGAVSPAGARRPERTRSPADTKSPTNGRRRPDRGRAGTPAGPTAERNQGAPRKRERRTPDPRAAPATGSPPRHPPAPAPAPAPARAAGFLEIRIQIEPRVAGLEILGQAPAADPEAVELARLAARIRDAETYQRLLALERARGLIPFSHQEETARKVLSVFLGRALLADEVGLGKTVEAGIVLSELLLRGRVERALVLVPPSLVAQWREELGSKFAIQARTTDDPAFRSDPAGFWRGPGVAIASLPTARAARRRDQVTEHPWDMVIVDEAHVLKNANTEAYRLVSHLSSRFLLLLTATPVENRIEEVYNLVSLIRPGHLGARAEFLRRYSDARLRSNESARAEIRAVLGDVMVRNTRALSGVRLPPRFAHTLLVQPDPAEATLYQHLAAALRTLGPGGSTRLLLSLLLQEAGSSPLAVAPTLVKLRSNPELTAAARAALAPAIACAETPAGTGKGAALLRLARDRDQPAVVFTRFRATLDYLAALLTGHGIPHERLDGNVPAPLRHEALARFRERGGVLLSTEVGAEGLNLQFCRRIVNFDLPWNPMRIEQRIGRVHRIGQDHPVEVINFCLAGSIEERILEILDRRINLFELVVGETEMILGYLEDEREFDALVLDAFADRDPEARERSFTRIGDALAAARARYENVKRFDEAFFRDELGV